MRAYLEKMSLKKEIFVFLAIFAAAAVVRGLFGEIFYENEKNIQPQIAEKILRFHVIANSDSEADQSVKLKVRDGVLNYLAPLFENCESKEDCKKVVNNNIDNIEKKAEEILSEQGFNDTLVTVSLKNRFFPVKKYGEYTFPQGEYEALCIEIGKAEGKNWWCVLYPRLCFLDSLYAVVPDESREELRGVLSEEEYNAVFTSNNAKIKVKFHIAEWLNSCDNLFD